MNPFLDIKMEKIKAGLICFVEDCENPVENPDIGLCATHAHQKRKAALRILKSLLKPAKPKIKQKPKAIKKISGRMADALKKYTKLRDKFLRDKRCAIFPHLPATQVHHKKGRVGYADDFARQAGITLLLDTRHWLPVSLEAHEKITRDSKWAIEMGYSIPRNQKN